MKPGSFPGKVAAACGGLIALEEGTPRSHYQGRPVYFCLAVCKEEFDRNPALSCYSCQLSSEDPDETG